MSYCICRRRDGRWRLEGQIIDGDVQRFPDFCRLDSSREGVATAVLRFVKPFHYEEVCRCDASEYAAREYSPREYPARGYLPSEYAARESSPSALKWFSEHP